MSLCHLLHSVVKVYDSRLFFIFFSIAASLFYASIILPKSRLQKIVSLKILNSKAY